MRTNVWCDGGCKNGVGGWGVFIEDPAGQTRRYSGYDFDTTNNRMELIAVREALLRIWRGGQVRMVCDSQYVLYGITDYISKWKKNGWHTYDGAPVKNRDLWEDLDSLVVGRNIDWRWTKGHRKDRGNIIADRLASEARKLAEGK